MARARHRVSNIGPGEQRQRYLMGYGLLALSVGLSVFYRLLDQSPWWHLSLFFPLWGSMLGLLQGRGGT